MAYMYQTVRNLYDGDKWKRRVENMSDNQIIAIFYTHLQKKQAAAKSVPVQKCEGHTCDNDECVPRQLSFFDWIE